jgi:hypothetical protein
MNTSSPTAGALLPLFQLLNCTPDPSGPRGFFFGVFDPTDKFIAANWG